MPRRGGPPPVSAAGLFGRIHQDLKQLSDTLVAARKQWVNRGPVGPPPLQRIVLYIDDLDRCPPEKRKRSSTCFRTARRRPRHAQLREKADTPGEKAARFTESSPVRRVDDLQPEGLRLSAAEREFLPLLGPLLPTPRSAKRLVNLYRLLRIGIPEAELPAFVGGEDGGPYQAATVLLATVIGLPADARGVLTALRDANPGEDIVSFLGATAGIGRRT